MRFSIKYDNAILRIQIDTAHKDYICTAAWCSGVYIRWNGMVEWNSGMDYWNGNR